MRGPWELGLIKTELVTQLLELFHFSPDLFTCKLIIEFVDLQNLINLASNESVVTFSSMHK